MASAIPKASRGSGVPADAKTFFGHPRGLFMLFFADRSESAVTQAVLMGSVATVIAAMLLLIQFLDSPFQDGVGGVRPVAMERTLRIIDEALQASLVRIEGISERVHALEAGDVDRQRELLEQEPHGLGIRVPELLDRDHATLARMDATARHLAHGKVDLAERPLAYEAAQCIVPNCP